MTKSHYLCCREYDEHEGAIEQNTRSDAERQYAYDVVEKYAGVIDPLTTDTDEFLRQYEALAISECDRFGRKAIELGEMARMKKGQLWSPFLTTFSFSYERFNDLVSDLEVLYREHERYRKATAARDDAQLLRSRFVEKMDNRKVKKMETCDDIQKEG